MIGEASIWASLRALKFRSHQSLTNVESLAYSTKRLAASSPPKPMLRRISEMPARCSKVISDPSSLSAMTVGKRGNWQMCVTFKEVHSHRNQNLYMRQRMAMCAFCKFGTSKVTDTLHSFHDQTRIDYASQKTF